MGCEAPVLPTHVANLINHSLFVVFLHTLYLKTLKDLAILNSEISSLLLIPLAFKHSTLPLIFYYSTTRSILTLNFQAFLLLFDVDAKISGAGGLMKIRS